MEIPHIILKMNYADDLFSTDGIWFQDIIECNNEEELRIFTSFEDAKKYQEKNSIDGRVVALPIY